MRGRFEWMGPDAGSSMECFAAKRGDSFHVDGSRWELSQVKDATEKAGFLIVGFSRDARLELRARVVGSRHPFWLVFRPMMMMNRTRKDVDHEVSGQCGDGNQGTAQKKLHLTSAGRRQRRLPAESSSSVLLSHTQSKQTICYRQGNAEKKILGGETDSEPPNDIASALNPEPCRTRRKSLA